MKHPTFLTALIAAALGGPALAADFTGAAAPGAWSVANVGTLIGAAPTFGTATFSAIQLVLVGSNSVSPNPGNLAPGCAGGVYSVLSSPCQLQVTLGMGGTYSFDWSYVTADPDGPAGDIFGVVVDGTRIALSDLGGAIAQSGSASFTAVASFGWFLNCTDCIGGFANATVSGFVLTPVPEPAPWALMLGGALGLGALQRRRAR